MPEVSGTDSVKLMDPSNSYSHSLAESRNLLEQNQHNFRLKSLFTPSSCDRRLLAELIITPAPTFPISAPRSATGGKYQIFGACHNHFAPFPPPSRATGCPQMATAAASLKSATGSPETVAKGAWPTFSGATTRCVSLPHLPAPSPPPSLPCRCCCPVSLIGINLLWHHKEEQSSD